MANPYEILGIRPTDSLDAAETAYHRLVRSQHPDLHHAEGPEAVARAEQLTLALNEAIAAVRLDHRYRDQDAATSRANHADGWSATGRSGAGPGPGSSRSGAAGAPGPDGFARAETRPRRDQTGPPPPGPEAPGAGAWVNDHAAGADCPFCGLHIADLDSFDAHLFEVHEFRVFNERGASWFGWSPSRTTRDVLTVVGLAVASVALLALTRLVSISPMWWFLLWLVIVATVWTTTFGSRSRR